MKFLFTIVLLLGPQAFNQELAGFSKSKNAQTFINSKTETETPKYTKYDPFFDACKKPDANKKIIPIEAISPIKFGVPQIVQSDQQGHTAFDLINSAYKYTQSVLKQNLENTKKSLACVDEVFKKNITDIKSECHGTLDDVANSAMANQRARYELAIALPNSQILNDTQYQTLNTELNIPINTFKANPWNPLTVREKNILSEKWNSFLNESEIESKEKSPSSFSYTAKPVSHQIKLDLIEQKRKSAMLNYHLQMTKYPLIQFIQTDDPGPGDFKKAYELVIQNIEKEMDNIKSKQNKLVLNSNQKISTDDLYILNYQTTENLLQSNPEYCSIAQSLMEFQKKKQMYIAGGTMAVMLGATASGYVPAAALFTAGSALSGYTTYVDYVKYKESMQAHLASPIYEDQVFRKTKVDKDKEAVVIGATVSVALGLPAPVKLTQYLSQVKTISASQISKYFEKKALIKKINALENPDFSL